MTVQSQLETTVSATYKWVLLAVIALTIGSFVLANVFPILGSVANTDYSDTTDNLWKTFYSGFSALLGLLGGKAV